MTNCVSLHVGGGVLVYVCVGGGELFQLQAIRTEESLGKTEEDCGGESTAVV